LFSVAQHFLLTAAARSLSLKAIMKMTDDEARARFRAIRWADNGGEPFCPRCECTVIYTMATRNLWKCKACRYQFSVTSGTIFASRKLPVQDYLAAIAIFVNAVKGISALQLGRDLDVQYKTAFVLAHKLREAIGAGHAEGQLSGVVEIDGAYFGGHGKRGTKTEVARKSVVVARERAGRTLTTVCAKEADGVAMVRARVAPGTGCSCR
jgi:transposase-like protein